MNTSVKQKRLFWSPFIRACRSQWEGGGKRYALTEDKEFTDLVCESGGPHGDNWILQNIIKYCGEIMNAKRCGEKPQEVNYFKIAVYAFLAWIKQKEEGYSHIDSGEQFYSD